MTATLRRAEPGRIHGAGWLLVAATGAGVLNYAYAVLLTHGLTPAQYTAFAAGQALLMVRAAISAAGIPWLVARELGRDGGDGDAAASVVTFAFWNSIWLGLVLSALLAAGVAAFGSARCAAVVGVTSVVMSVGSTGMGFLQGRHRMTAIAALMTAEAAVKVGVGALLVFGLGYGAAGALAGFLAGSLVLLWPLPMVRRYLRRPRRPGADLALIQAALRQTGMQLGVAVIAATDTVMIALLALGGQLGGPYQAASALGRVPLFASNALSTAVFPTLQRHDATASKTAALRAYLAVAVFATAALVSLPAGIRSLFFPASFDAVGRWLPYTAPLGLLIGLLSLLVTFAQAQQRIRRPVTHLAAATVGYVAGVAAAGAIGGVGALALAATVLAAVAVAILALLPPERAAVAALPSSPRAGRDVVVTAAVAAVLLTVDQPVIWTVLATGAGLAILLLSFPEFTTTFTATRRGRLDHRVTDRR